MRCWCNRRFASSRATVSRTVTRPSLVISSATGWRGSSANRTSRLVRMPASLPDPRSTTGMPEILWSAISRSASARGLVRVDRDRVDHHPGLEFLDLADFVGLLLDAHVAVDDADSAGLRHRDRERAFGHRIHRRRDQRDAELDLAGEASPGIGLPGHDHRRRRHQHHVVEGQSLPNFHRRLLSDGDALYTTTPPQEEIGAGPSRPAPIMNMVFPPLLGETQEGGFGVRLGLPRLRLTRALRNAARPSARPVRTSRPAGPCPG